MSPRAPREWWQPETATQDRPSASPSTSSTIAFRALVVFTLILFLAPQSFLPMLRPFRIALFAATVAIGAHLLDRVFTDKPFVTPGPAIGLTLGLVVWSVVTLPLSYWPHGSASFLFEAYFKTVAIFWLLSEVVDSPVRLRQVAWCLTGLAIPLALTGVKNFASGSFVEVGNVRRIVGYEAGLTENPNDLALVLNLILPLTIALWRSCRDSVLRILLSAIALLLATGVIVTFSRGGFLTLGAILSILLFRMVRRGRIGWAAICVGAALAGVLLLPADYIARLGTITDIQSDTTGSAQARWRDTEAAARFVAEHPLIGAGVGMNTLALNDVRGAVWTQVHNVYLEYAVELGLPGLTLFLLLYFTCLHRARNVRKKGTLPEQSDLSHLAEGIEISLLAFGVAALFYPIAYHFDFYYLAGMAVASERIERAPSADERSVAMPVPAKPLAVQPLL